VAFSLLRSEVAGWERGEGVGVGNTKACHGGQKRAASSSPDFSGKVSKKLSARGKSNSISMGSFGGLGGGLFLVGLLVGFCWCFFCFVCVVGFVGGGGGWVFVSR